MNQTLKQKLILLVLLAFVCSNFISCSKACFYKKLGPLSCDPDFIPVSGAEYKSSHASWKHPTDELVVINDLESYKQSCANYGDSMPLGYIDFAAKSLVGLKIEMDMNGGYDHQGCFCYNPEKDKWEFKIEYTLKHQCKGSGIGRTDLFCYVICPKLPANAVVESNVRNINPFY